MTMIGTTLQRAIRFGLLVGIVGLMIAEFPEAAVSTHQINAKGAGQDLGGGQTEARVIGGGLLSGRTTAQFAITGDAFPVFEIEGDVTFQTHEGATLTVHVTGTFDVSTGEFSASGPVTDATGRLTGATGMLTFIGIQDLVDGTFTEDITGSITVDLAP